MSDSVQPHRRQPTRLLSPWHSPGKNTGVGCHFVFQCMKVKSESEVAQLGPTPPDPMDCSLPGSSIHGIFQARVLEWVAISFSRGSSQPRNRTGVSCTAGRFLTSWAAREAWAGGYQALKAKNGLTLQECVRPNGKSSRSWSSQVPQASFPVQQVVRFWGGWRWQPEAILQD